MGLHYCWFALSPLHKIYNSIVLNAFRNSHLAFSKHTLGRRVFGSFDDKRSLRHSDHALRFRKLMESLRNLYKDLKGGSFDEDQQVLGEEGGWVRAESELLREALDFLKGYEKDLEKKQTALQ